MKRIVIILASLSVMFSSGCASMLARCDSNHEPGTLYPGTRIYISNFTEEREIPGDHPDKRLMGPVMATTVFIVVAPFWIADMILTPTYETIALPYDYIKALGKRENPTAN